MNTDTETTTEEEDVSAPRGPGRPRGTLGHTELVALKLHPDLKEYLNVRSREEYISVPDYLRRLIVADMRDAS